MSKKEFEITYEIIQREECKCCSNIHMHIEKYDREIGCTLKNSYIKQLRKYKNIDKRFLLIAYAFLENYDLCRDNFISFRKKFSIREMNEGDRL